MVKKGDKEEEEEEENKQGTKPNTTIPAAEFHPCKMIGLATAINGQLDVK